MYLEISLPHYSIGAPTLIILNVKEDNGAVVQTCTSTPERFETTVDFLAKEFRISGIVDKRFTGLAGTSPEPDETGSI